MAPSDNGPLRTRVYGAKPMHYSYQGLSANCLPVLVLRPFNGFALRNLWKGEPVGGGNLPRPVRDVSGLRQTKEGNM